MVEAVVEDETVGTVVVRMEVVVGIVGSVVVVEAAVVVVVVTMVLCLVPMVVGLVGGGAEDEVDNSSVQLLQSSQ